MARRVLRFIVAGLALSTFVGCSSKQAPVATGERNSSATLIALPEAAATSIAAADTQITDAASNTSSSPQYQIAQADLDALGAEINLSPEEKEALTLVSAVAP